MQLAIFGITNDGLNLAVNLILLILVVVWIALIVYTFLDARRRIEDPVLVACATIASFVPYVGTAVYAILRPPEYLEDARERELEIQAAEMKRARALRAVLPQLQLHGREELPPLPELPAAPQGPVPLLRQAGRPALGPVPLLRDPDARPRPRWAPRATGQREPPSGEKRDRRERERERPKRSERSERAEPSDRRTSRPAPRSPEGRGNSSSSVPRGLGAAASTAAAPPGVRAGRRW